MALPLVDAADVLRAVGLTVVEMDGWQTRGETDGPFYNRGLILHWDAMALGWNDNPADDFNVPQNMARNGVDGSQLWVSRKGVWYCLAAGRKWHAGVGGPWSSIPVNAGNSYCAGIETDHTVGEPWERPQIDSIDLGSWALAQRYGYTPSFCCGHSEYAPDRKQDPGNFDLATWRAHLAGTVPPFPPPGDDSMSAADVADLKKYFDAQLAPVKAQLAHLTTFVDGNPVKPSGFDRNGQAARAVDTLAKINRLLTKFSP